MYIYKIYSDLGPTVHFLRLFFPAQLYGATRRLSKLLGSRSKLRCLNLHLLLKVLTFCENQHR